MLDLTASPSHIISEINRLALKVDGPQEAEAGGDPLSTEDQEAVRDILGGKDGGWTAADLKEAINKLNDLHGKFLPSPGLPIDPGPPKLATAETPVMPAPMGAAKPPLEHKATPAAAAADAPRPPTATADRPQPPASAPTPPLPPMAGTPAKPATVPPPPK